MPSPTTRAFLVTLGTILALAVPGGLVVGLLYYGAVRVYRRRKGLAA